MTKNFDADTRGILPYLHKDCVIKNLLVILLIIVCWPIGILVALKYRHWLNKWYVVFPVLLYAAIFSFTSAAVAEKLLQDAENRRLENNWQQMIDEELGRQYYIDINNSITNNTISVDCNMKQIHNDDSRYSGSGDQFQCQGVDITGKYSRYNTVQLRLGDGDNNRFSATDDMFAYADVPRVISSSDWEENNFDANSHRLISDTVELILNNKRINGGCDLYKRIIKIEYRLSDEELDILSQHNNEYQKYAAEQKRLAEEDAKRRLDEEAERKAKEEAEKRAADEKKRQEENSSQLEQNQQENTANSSSEDDVSSSEINEGLVVCGSYLEHMGYPNAKIKPTTIQVYSDGTPGGIYIKGQATYDPGVTQSEVSMGTVNCRYDTINGQVKKVLFL